MPEGLLRWLLGAALWCLAGVAQAAVPALELTQARAEISAGGATQVREVALPFMWDMVMPGQAGRARLTLRFALPDGVRPREGDPWALYLPRVGNRFSVALNGVLLQRQGSLQQDGGDDYGLMPRFIEIPSVLLQPHNEILVELVADLGRKGGLAPVTLGPVSLLLPRYRDGHNWRTGSTLLVVAFSFFVGLLSLCLWLMQPDMAVVAAGRRSSRDAVYFFAALAELSWTLGAGYLLIESPPLPWPWWGVLSILAGAVWRASMVCLCMEAAGLLQLRGVRLLRQWILVLAVLVPVTAVLALHLGQPGMLTAGYLLEGLTMSGFSLLFLSHAWRRPGWLLRALAAALLVNVLVGGRDLLVYRLTPTYVDITWLRYSSVLFGIALLAVVLSRFREVSLQARELLSSLSTRVAQKERELKASFERTEVLARQQERSVVRANILRDMHDGVGSHISSAIRQLESGRASQADVLLTLRDSLDQLKLSIDAIHLPAGDVTALLANMRYRLEPRFIAIDMELQWDVDLLPVLEQLDGRAMRQLQYMLFEALSNVLQHARARVLRLEAHAEPVAAAGAKPRVRVRVVDDGCGFNVTGMGRRGLASMRERANAIRARLSVTSEPGRTVVEIGLG